MKKLLPLTLGCLALCLPACSQNNNVPAVKNVMTVNSGNYIPNGDFEKVAGNQLPNWKMTGAVKPEAASGAWKRLSAKFKSESNTKVSFFFWVPRGASGSVWIDNLSAGPDIHLKNSGFEAVDTKGIIPDWTNETKNNTVFSDTTRASEGKRSLRVSHAHEAIPVTMVWQDFAVEPNKEYTFSFDIFVGDDFQGEAKGWLFNAAHATSLDFEIENLVGSKIVEARDRSGRFNVLMTPKADAPAALSQDVSVQPNANLQAGLDFDNSKFKGSVKLIIEDAASGQVLHQVEATESQEKWQSKRFSFQSGAPRVRVRAIATGEGELRLDNLAITAPQITPPLQQVRWSSATDNFAIPATLKVQVQGKTGVALDGALGLLNKDLKPHGAAAEKQADGAAPMQILIGEKYAVKDKGDEAYSLEIDSKKVVIQAGTEGGAFYGLMTLLQLIDVRDGKPVFLPCQITDYPDMPMRGFLYADAEQAARYKMNTLMVSTGYMVSPEDRKQLHALVQQAQSLNLNFIPMFMTLQGSYYVQQINPNLAAGIWVQNEKVTLKGEGPAALANSYVVRTKLSDVVLKSSDGQTTYVPGEDYQVIDGEMKYNYDNPNAKPFSVVRLPGSAIEDGETVLASYDYVSHMRKRNDVHMPYVPLEPEAQKLTADFLTDLAKEFNFDYINSPADLHEFFIPDGMLATDSRVIKSGKKPIDLLIDDAHSQDAAIKRGNPKTRLFQWTGDVANYALTAAPHLPKDSLINIWGYDASWPSAEGRKAIEYWTGLGYETSVMPWDNMRNIHEWAAVVAEARKKGYPCHGIIGSGWEGRPTGFKETAVVAWRVPKVNEKGYVALPQEKEPDTKKNSNP